MEDQTQGGAPAAKRGRMTLTVIFERREHARREGTASSFLCAVTKGCCDGHHLAAAARKQCGGSGPRLALPSYGSGPPPPVVSSPPHSPHLRRGILACRVSRWLTCAYVRRNAELLCLARRRRALEAFGRESCHRSVAGAAGASGASARTIAMNSRSFCFSCSGS